MEENADWEDTAEEVEVKDDEPKTDDLDDTGESQTSQGRHMTSIRIYHLLTVRIYQSI